MIILLAASSTVRRRGFTQGASAFSVPFGHRHLQSSISQGIFHVVHPGNASSSSSSRSSSSVTLGLHNSFRYPGVIHSMVHDRYHLSCPLSVTCTRGLLLSTVRTVVFRILSLSLFSLNLSQESHFHSLQIHDNHHS